MNTYEINKKLLIVKYKIFLLIFFIKLENSIIEKTPNTIKL